jgi:hypothetical protein
MGFNRAWIKTQPVTIRAFQNGDANRHHPIAAAVELIPSSIVLAQLSVNRKMRQNQGVEPKFIRNHV